MATTTRNSGMPRSVDFGAVDAEANWKNADESRLRPPARLGVKAKYLFRFPVGAGPRNMSVFLDYARESIEDRVQKFHDRSFERRTKKLYGDQMGADLGFNLDSLREKMGGNYIEFTPIPGNPQRQGSCYLATDDDEVAAYIRYRMQTGSGHWQLLREEHPTEMIEVNGMRIPNTAEGWDAARIAAMRGMTAITDKE